MLGLPPQFYGQIAGYTAVFAPLVGRSGRNTHIPSLRRVLSGSNGNQLADHSRT